MASEDTLLLVLASWLRHQHQHQHQHQHHQLQAACGGGGAACPLGPEDLDDLAGRVCFARLSPAYVLAVAPSLAQPLLHASP